MVDESGTGGSVFVYLSNRGSEIFRAALEPIGGREYQEGDPHIDLLYFDQFGGKEPPRIPTIGFTLIDRQRTIPLDNKSSMANALIDVGITYPRVFFTEEDVPDEPGSLWFIKDPLTTAGKGISVVTREQIARRFQFGAIIQEAVQDVALINNRKFTLRIYVLVNRGKLFLYPAGIIVLHGAQYDPLSVDPLVQFEHNGYMNEDSPIKMLPFTEFASHVAVFENLGPHLVDTFAAFSDLLKYEKAHTYCLFGLDVLVRRDLSTVLVEINDRPNLVHTRRINEQVNIPVVQAMCCVLDPERARHRPPTTPGFEWLVDL
ncbi:MAG: hypothetical protein O2971_14100 [Proteobacteria bacterium]|nr:hypothetical protein [Pseudomonadota bacterium]